MATPDDVNLPTFGLALRGYDRAAVDAHVADAAHRIAEMSEEVTRLREAVVAAERQRVALSQRGSELLRAAESQAAETLDLARGGEMEPAEVYERTRTDCEHLLTAAQTEARRVLDEARNHAATIEERARQEFAWRRRRVREEQTLVDLRKQQIVRQIATLSVLATKTAVEPASSLPIEPAVSATG